MSYTFVLFCSHPTLPTAVAVDQLQPFLAVGLKAPLCDFQSSISIFYFYFYFLFLFFIFYFFIYMCFSYPTLKTAVAVDHLQPFFAVGLVVALGGGCTQEF